MGAPRAPEGAGREGRRLWSSVLAEFELSGHELSLLRQAAREDAITAARERKEREEREAAREQRLETMLFAERQLGQPMAEMSRARSALAEANDECAELQARLAKAEARRASAQSSLTWWAQRAQQATGLAQRSAPAGVEGAVAEARRALAEAAREDDILRRARRSQE